MDIRFIDIYDLLLNPPAIEYLIEGLIEDQTNGAIIGESGSGKTFVALSLALSVVTGVQFAGREVKRVGTVIYFVGEGRQGIPRRIRAWERHHGISIPRGRLYMPSERVTFDAEGASKVETALAELPAEYKPPALLIIDTLARALPPDSDENSTRDMMAFLNLVDDLRKKNRCVAVIVHHTGHGEDKKSRARGSSAFRASIDWEYLTKKGNGKKGQGKLEVTKMKDAEIPGQMPFCLVQSEESVVPVFGGPEPADGPKLNKLEQFALSTLKATFFRLNRENVTVDEWREHFYEMDKADKPETKRQNFNRARNSLVKKEVLLFDEEHYTIA